MPAPAARASRPWRAHWPAIALALVAAAVAVWAREAIFPALSWNRDEPVYLWHAEVLREGQLTAPDGGYPELFLPWLSAADDGSMFTQYTLGWPLVLLLAHLLTGSAATALPVGAALAVVGTYALTIELFDDRRRATLAGVLLVASPILPIQGGVYLSYLFTLGLGLLFGALLLSGHRLGRPRRLVVAGFLLGWIFLTRPYDAVLWGLAFGAYLLLNDRRGARLVLRRLVVCGAAALPLVVAGLAYNRYVTGSWLEFPITVADPLDTFGFGRRRLMPGFDVVDYDVGTALKGTARNAFFLPWFLAGSYVSLAVAAVGLWIGRRDRATLGLVLAGAVFPVGYFVFWGNHLSSLAARISGPIYLIPLYVPICILVASMLARWWTTRRALAWGVAALLVVGTVPVAVSRLDVNRDVSEQQEAWKRSTASLEGPALVLVADTGAHLLYANPFGGNDPDLDDDVLFAALNGPTVLHLIAEQPERAVYVQSATVPSPELGPREDPRPLDVLLTAAEVRRGAGFVLEITVTPPPGATHVALDVSTGAGDTRRELAVSRPSQVVQVPLQPGAGVDAMDLAAAGRIEVAMGWGDSRAAAAVIPLVRQELLYRVIAGGTVEVLLPASSSRHEQVGRTRQWRHAPGLTELALDLRPLPAAA